MEYNYAKSKAARWNRRSVLNEDWIIYRMVHSHRLLPLVLVAIGVGRWIPKEK
jgi:hypothetical protein